MIRTPTRHRRTAVPSLLALLLLPVSAQGQDADPADVRSVDGIVTALYASISGPTGQERDVARFRSLFAPDARLMPTAPVGPNTPHGYLALTPEQYWDRAAANLTQMGFTEAEIGRTTEEFGRITHVFSTYESYREDQGSPDIPFARGINSIQLVQAAGRYWILSVFWDSERPDNPIPERYLGVGTH